MLSKLAQNGRFVLVAGLIAGAGLPILAAKILPMVGYLVAALLFLNAFRTGERIKKSLKGSLARTAAIVISLQLVLPLCALGVFTLTGTTATPFAFAAVLMMSAPALTGAPNFVSMAGRDPTDAMRILVVGTLFFPLTALIVLWAMPEIDAPEALSATIRLAATIFLVVVAGAVARRIFSTRFDSVSLNTRCDGLSSLLLFIIVIGLMSNFGPLLRSSIGTTLIWVAAVMALNLSLQFCALALFRKLQIKETVSVSVIAGNRNIALFLVALQEDVMQHAMLFIGCYQIPMYLTPLIMRRALSQKPNPAPENKTAANQCSS